MEKIQAQQKLNQIFKLKRFYDNQWETIKRLLNGERLLLIEKTGFGKSLCYQFPATQFSGMTIIFSPLIALMRDQVNYLKSIGIAAACVNSEQDLEQNSDILEKAKQNQIKILYIAPERQENQQWIEAVRQMNLSMVVIDEAHCISVWGHDFRPAFRRIINLVKLLPENFPVLATTATATQQVADDIMNQMGKNVTFIRGNLLRENFSLNVVKVKSEDDKMVWLAEYLQTKPGTGIIYTGTRVNTDLFANWLQHVGISAVNYNAGLDAETRQEIEAGLMANRWKCIVSTNALGMGIDKPDVRFIIHTQIPQSPIHYYQEIGRAGRDGKATDIFLLYNPADIDLPTHFIKNNKPALKKYFRVIEALKIEPLGEHDLMRNTNLTQTQVRVIRADLIDQGIIKEVMYGSSKKYEYQFGAPDLDTKPFEALRQFKFSELDKITEYAESKTCRMDFLCSYLGDTSVGKCEKCDNDLQTVFSVDLNNFWHKKINEFKDNYFPELPVEMKTSKMVNGIASSYYGFSNVGSIIHRCKYENGGDFPGFLLIKTLKAFRYKFKDEKFDLLVYVPPTESGDLVKNFAEKISLTLNIPISHNLRKIRNTEPQKVFQNSVLKRDNIKNAFTFESQSFLQGKKILVVDDIFDSGATFKEIGRMFSKLGASKIAPIVIAKTIGGDI
ncbi:RecQ family ATP-dependent DNA helicase [candidate division KSB1 bacterium]|nr:RecQ family ATP-dependent DNA helicase [candidate division KSB1 bacterium]MBL7093929.1 RecQ family ATP-dependent DNA helicase [candidate division KSB1 bacterium]